MRNKIFEGDSLFVLKTFESESVDCIVTSPPYFGLRDYGVGGQIGLEPTPQRYVESIVAVFREAKRVLKNNGTLWLNIGDSYASYRDSKSTPDSLRGKSAGTKVPISNNRNPKNLRLAGLKHKDLCGVPWRVAFALQADGWYLRQDIIWSKPNPMPESVSDRCTKSHEYVFLFSKSPRYHFDNKAIKEPIAESSRGRLAQNIAAQKGSSRVPGKNNGAMKARGDLSSGTRNKRSVWTVTTKPFKSAHFATFPADLIEPMILAGCPQGGVCLDPFMGAGTTALVCKKLGRDYVGIELNPEYIKMAENRIGRQEAFPFPSPEVH